MKREELVEQIAYHGYAKNGRPIPKRSSLLTQPQCPAVQPTAAHRVGHRPGWQPEDLPYQTADMPQRNAQAYDTGVLTHLRNPYQTLTFDELFEFEEDEQDTTWPPRLPGNSLRFDLPEGRYIQSNTRLNVHHGAPPPAPQQPAHPSRQQVDTDKRTAEEREKQGLRPHWLVSVGLAMLVMVMGWVVLTFVADWYQVTQGDWK